LSPPSYSEQKISKFQTSSKSCHCPQRQWISLFQRPFSRWTWVSRYQNVSFLDSIGAKGDGGGGDNWSHKTCKAPVKSSPSTNQHPIFTGRMTFLSPNKQCQSTEGKPLWQWIYRVMMHI